MRLQVNGDALELPDGATIASLIDTLALGGKRLAIEVNEDIVPRSQHADFVLHDGDRVEIVHAIGGG